MENKDEKLIKDRYWASEEFRQAADKAAERTKHRTGESVPNESSELIENYLKRFTDILDREDEHDRERGLEAIKRLLHRKYIVKPENISNDYIKGVLFGNFAEQKGYTRKDLKDPDIKQGLLEQFQSDIGHDFNNYDISDDEKENVREMAIKDQTARLDSWLDYLTSQEAENYPAAYRYWALAEMVKLGNYDEDRKAYNKRTETTAASFPELDQQALALVFDEIRRKQNQEPSQLIPADQQSQEEFKKRLQAENFGKLYAFMQEHLKSLRLPEERLIITEGEWRTFPKGSDPKQVAKALEGYHTQWCIAGEGTAAGYLEHSDLNIYFSQDIEGKNIIPRACVVDSKDMGITEVRGVMSDEAAKQHLDDHITPIVEEKLTTIPGGEKWQQQMEDMKQLVAIHVKHRQRDNLTKDDLKFLYELDHSIRSMGYGQDPRIKEICEDRNIANDVKELYGFDFAKPDKPTLEFIYDVGIRPTPSAFIDYAKRFRKGRDTNKDTLVIFECSQDQIAENIKDINKNTKAYIGKWNVEIFQKIRNYSNINHLYESFPDKKIFMQALETDPKINSPKSAEEAMERKNIYCSDCGKDILYKTEFSKEKQKYDLVGFTVEQLGFPNGATTDEIYKKADDLGLELCPAETGPNLRLQYSGKEWLQVGMKQISDRDGSPRVFRLSADGEELELRGDYARSDSRWAPDGAVCLFLAPVT